MESKSLFELKTFWLSIIIPVILALVFTLWIVSDPNLDLKYQIQNPNNLLDTFKIPISLIALIFPLAALVATAHRSRQTANQLELSIKQNLFANYFKHKNEFIKKFQHSYSLIDAERAHHTIFPGVIEGNYSVNEELINSTEKIIKNLIYEYGRLGPLTITKDIKAALAWKSSVIRLLDTASALTILHNYYNFEEEAFENNDFKYFFDCLSDLCRFMKIEQRILNEERIKHFCEIIKSIKKDLIRLKSHIERLKGLKEILDEHEIDPSKKGKY